jgi:hypothetical protein
MGRSVGTLPDDYVDRLDEEAEELGLARSRYVRQRLEAGRLLFECSDKLSTETFSGLVDLDASPTVANELETPDNDIADKVLANLPTDEKRALEQEEIREVVFGSHEEQLEIIEKTLRELNERGIVKAAFDGGYIKTNEQR